MSARTAVVVGNPFGGGRTLAAARRLLSELTGRDEADLVIDLSTVGAGLLDWQDADVAALVREVAAADLVIVASPTYKATYSGLLKLFLDRFAPGHGSGLTGLAVPLMLGGAPAHALAVEVHLRPLLAEIGALVPTAGLFLLDADHDAASAYEPWLARHRDVVTTLLATRIGAPA
ncbi:NAD(P)H-dependent oxidoreductase [Nocardioides sp.]|uniref:NAD(P)H-dependent oxidoreductase n=1 Tax=Nocardioides sp. TaxID=35761 RepID=UPI0035198A33